MTSSGHDEEAREAAQHVADSAESWEHGAEKSTAREHLDEGVDVPEGEKEQLVDDIKDGDASPVVKEATPKDQ